MQRASISAIISVRLEQAVVNVDAATAHQQRRSLRCDVSQELALVESRRAACSADRSSRVIDESCPLGGNAAAVHEERCVLVER
eukprot:5914060-Prymnesium_polylepis.1